MHSMPPGRPIEVIRLASECHHIRGRNGDLLLDERYWLPSLVPGVIDGLLSTAKKAGIFKNRWPKRQRILTNDEL